MSCLGETIPHEKDTRVGRRPLWALDLPAWLPTGLALFLPEDQLSTSGSLRPVRWGNGTEI
jgi:hypothetical protein